jgi:prophage antirepressor-like protein
MNTIQKFYFKTNQVRIVLVNNEPWWVAKDVCSILALNNVSMTLDTLDSEEKGISKVDTPGGIQSISIINESGLYGLIFKSRKAKAKAFRKWVTREVLPQIRKTGSYTIQIPKTLPEALRAFATEVEAHEATKALLIEQQPKIDAWRQFIDSEGLIELTHVAQACKTGRNTLYKKLRNENVFYYKGSYNSVYQQYINRGYFNLKYILNDKRDHIPVIKCTPKGAEWIYTQFYRRVAT